MSEDGLAIEIGPRTSPYAPELNSKLFPSVKGKILYVEKGGDWLPKLKEFSEGQPVMQGDAANLAIRNNSADLVFLKDVIGHEGQGEYKKGRLIDKPAQTGGIVRISHETSRITKPGGRVVILETGTPPDKRRIIEEFAKNNMVLSNEYDKKHLYEIFEEPVVGNAISTVATEDSFALIFEKK